MKTGRYWFVLTLLFLVGCSSNEGKITGQWLFVGSDPASQQKWTQAKPILVFNDDQSFSWSRTDENGESQTIDGQYSLRPRNWVYMKSETAAPDWNWEKGSNETVLIAGSTLKIFLSKDETQFLIFQKSNGIDVPLVGEKSVGTPASGSGANAVSSTPPSPPKSNSSATPPQTIAASPSSLPGSRSPNSAASTPTAPISDLSSPARTTSQASKPSASSSAATQPGSAVSQTIPKQTTQSPPKTSATPISASGQSAARTTANVENHSKPTFSQKSDLLDSIVPRDNFVAGYWRKNGSNLIVPPTDFACLSLPAELPEFYQLSLSVERLSGFGAFYIGLIVADRPVVLRLIDDPLSSEKSGFDFASGKGASQTEFSTKIFEENKPVSIDCVVEKNKVRIIINGNETSSWSGDVGDFVFDSERWKNVPSRRCFLAAQGLSDFRIGKIEILQ